MAKQAVNHHAGNLMVVCDETGEVLTNQYDNTFPIVIFRNRINFLGGGKKLEDFSPESLVRREIQEEVYLKPNEAPDILVAQDAGVTTFETPKITQFASQSEIDELRAYFLNNMYPHQDFLMDFSGFLIEGGPKLKSPYAVFSIFRANLPIQIFNRVVRANLSQGKSLVNDGFLRITTLDELVSGNPLCAWATGKVLENYFGREIPSPQAITATPIGMPRTSFQDYLNDFEYVRF